MLIANKISKNAIHILNRQAGLMWAVLLIDQTGMNILCCKQNWQNFVQIAWQDKLEQSSFENIDNWQPDIMEPLPESKIVLRGDVKDANLEWREKLNQVRHLIDVFVIMQKLMPYCIVQS